MSDAASIDSMPVVPEKVEKGTSLTRDAWLRLQKNKLAMICLWVFAAIAALCFIGPYFKYIPGLREVLPDPNATHLSERSQLPNATYLLGSDHLGRDIFSRVVHGGRVSLMVGLLATLVSITIGVVYGAISGYASGRTDAVMMRIVDILYSMPFMIMVIILTTMFGNQLWLLFVAIGAVEWVTMARIVRGQIMSLKKQEFVEAAVSLGYSDARIIFRHLIPNTIGPVIVYTTLTVPSVMLLEAVLSYLGLGVQPPDSSWGTLIKEGADRMQSDPALLVFPAIFFSATLFCLNFLGDGLRDAFDPKSSKD